MKLFVVGNSRSGTTMMGRILGANDAVFTFHELHFFEQLWDPDRDGGPLDDRRAIALATRLLTTQRDGYYTPKDPALYLEEALDIIKRLPSDRTGPEVFGAFLERETLCHGRQVPCDQTPRNIYFWREILSSYPEAFIIHIVRDPRDVLLSQKGRWKRRRLGAGRMPLREVVRSWANYHPVTISAMWCSGIRVASDFATYPRTVTVRFEDVVAEPEESITRICELLGLSFQREMLRVPRMGSSHTSDSGALGLDAGAANRWRSAVADQTDLYLCQKMTFRRAKPLGYEAGAFRPNWLTLLWLAVTWLPKLALTFLLNAGRVRSLGSTIRRRLADGQEGGHADSDSPS